MPAPCAPAVRPTRPTRPTLTAEETAELDRLERRALREFPSANTAMSRGGFRAASGFLSDLTGIRSALGHAFFQPWLDRSFGRFTPNVRKALDTFESAVA